VLNTSLQQAFDQYVSDRVDTILSLAEVTDAKYNDAARGIRTSLEQLLQMAKQLEPQHPGLTRLVMEFESAAAIEAKFAIEITYKQGMRDLCGIRQELSRLLEEGSRQ
jgi:hypothetical protein